MSSQSKSEKPVSATPGARRAARLIQKEQQDYDHASFPLAQSVIAEIIDRETGTPDLLEALESAHRVLYLLADEVKALGCGGERVAEQVKAAISKAKGTL